MASSSAQPVAASSIGYPIIEKLGRNNFLLWKAQVMSANRGAQVVHNINPNAPVPAMGIPKAPDSKAPNHAEGDDFQPRV